MKKTKLSNLGAGKYFMIALGIFSFVMLIWGYKDFDTAVPPIIFLGISAILYRLFSQAKKVEFDEENLFISSNNETEIVPLKNVFSIKLTMTKLNYQHLWKIKYIGDNEQNKSVRILPTFAFDDFEKKVREKNPKVEIQNFSHSFDFDQ